MVLRIHSDTSYLTEPKVRNRLRGYFFLGNKDNEKISGPILTPTGTMKLVCSSAAEAETASLFSNMKEATAISTALEEMGYPQPPIPIQVDNNTAGSNADQKSSTCGFIGYKREQTKTSSMSTG